MSRNTHQEKLPQRPEQHNNTQHTPIHHSHTLPHPSPYSSHSIKLPHPFTLPVPPHYKAGGVTPPPPAPQNKVKLHASFLNSRTLLSQTQQSSFLAHTPLNTNRKHVETSPMKGRYMAQISDGKHPRLETREREEERRGKMTDPRGAGHGCIPRPSASFLPCTHRS